MTRTSMTGLLAAVLLVSQTAALAAPRAWVSAELGVDTGKCTRAAPCRTFDYAISQVDAGGEVNALDSGGYGPATIMKTVSINIAPGITAAIVATGSAAIIVNAGVDDIVSLRGLTITGNDNSIGIDGIQFGQLHIERVVMQGTGAATTTIGIRARAYSHPAVLTITDTVTRNHGSGTVLIGQNGPAAGWLQTTIERLRADGNGIGIGISGATRATLLEVTASANDTGLLVWGLSADFPSVVVERSALVGNATHGLRARSDGADTAVTLSGNTISGNGTGVTMQESIPGHLFVYTRNNNTLTQNGADVAGGTLTSLGAK